MMATKERSLDDLWAMHERKYDAYGHVDAALDEMWSEREAAERASYDASFGPGAYDAYEKAMQEMAEAQEAVDEGRATDLTHCYMCEPDVNKRFEEKAGPLRGIVRTGLIEEHRDPTVTYTLTPCGHTII